MSKFLSKRFLTDNPSLVDEVFHNDPPSREWSPIAEEEISALLGLSGVGYQLIKWA